MKNLLILGAGGHGNVVKEIAESVVDSKDEHLYERIEFLDDNSMEAIGKIVESSKYIGQFDCAFVGVGNNAVREQLQSGLEKLGYQIPVIIHSSAYVSKTAKIEAGTIVEPKAIVNASSVIGKGCIISVGAIVDHDSHIGAFCHINAGAICKAGSEVPGGTKLEAGQVVLGYGSPSFTKNA